ncbi:MAG: single-stranded DNA-binding protein [Dehalococcoidia bacterium]|nr:single-stranded DNA-binding protein [Dehalococcoidia bacterium]
MAGLNKMTIIGHLGNDPEMRFTANGTPVASFRVAVSQTFTGQDGEPKEETEWFTVVAWRKLAETCTQFLTKGRMAYVEGKLRSKTWEGSDGKTRFNNEITADKVLFLDRAKASATLPGGGGGDVEPDDLPF